MLHQQHSFQIPKARQMLAIQNGEHEVWSLSFLFYLASGPWDSSVAYFLMLFLPFGFPFRVYMGLCPWIRDSEGNQAIPTCKRKPGHVIIGTESNIPVGPQMKPKNVTAWSEQKLAWFACYWGCGWPFKNASVQCSPWKNQAPTSSYISTQIGASDFKRNCTAFVELPHIKAIRRLSKLWTAHTALQAPQTPYSHA